MFSATIDAPNSLDLLINLAKSANEKTKSIALGYFSILIAYTVKAQKYDLFRLALREIGSHLETVDSRWILNNCRKHLDVKSQEWMDRSIEKIMQGIDE